MTSEVLKFTNNDTAIREIKLLFENKWWIAKELSPRARTQRYRIQKTKMKKNKEIKKRNKNKRIRIKKRRE